MKKYSSVFTGNTIKLSDLSYSFSGNEYTVRLNKEIGYIWFYTVPKNTILKILNYKIVTSVVGRVRYKTIKPSTQEEYIGYSNLSMPVMTSNYFIKDINENTFQIFDSSVVYLNEGMSIGFHVDLNTTSKKIDKPLIGNEYGEGTTITDIIFDETALPQVQIFGMIEYDSYSKEISERLDSLSSRVTYLENLINTK